MKMRLSNRKTERRFFTLVELAAALTVAGFVVLITGTAAMSFWKTWEAAEGLTARLDEYRRIDTVMDTLVRNAVPFNWTAADGTNDTGSDLLFDGQENSLFFTSIRRAYAGSEGSLLFVRIRLEEGDLVADCSLFPRFPWLDERAEDPDMPWTREILARKVRSVSFLYADRNDSGELEWEEAEWDRETKNCLPLAVRMTVVWEDGTEESWLRRTAGSGASSVFGDRATTGTASSGGMMP